MLDGNMGSLLYGDVSVMLFVINLHIQYIIFGGTCLKEASSPEWLYMATMYVNDKILILIVIVPFPGHCLIFTLTYLAVSFKGFSSG